MAKKPNIILLMTDQQRFDTIGALGNPIIQTPGLNRIVREGTSFTSAYCPSPVCVASRCSFLLGQWPHQTVVYGQFADAARSRLGDGIAQRSRLSDTRYRQDALLATRTENVGI